MTNAKSSTALSPFLPSTQIQYAWDSTSLGYFKTCPRLYQYIMLEGWGSADESVHLRFGIEYHKALEDFARAKAEGVDNTEAMRVAVAGALTRTVDFNPDEDTKAGKYKNRRTLLQLVIDYLDHFEDDPAQTYIMKDGRPAVELSFRFELGWGPLGYPEFNEYATAKNSKQPYLLCGHLDRVVDFANHLYVMDRKTTYTTLSPHYFQQYHPHNQMSIYTIAGQVVLDSPIKGVIIDAAQILLDSPNRFVRGFAYRTPDQTEEWLHDLQTILAQAERYATDGYWPMNDTACDKFGGCRFREVCSKSPQVREKFLRSSFVQQPKEERWNPLKPR